MRQVPRSSPPSPRASLPEAPLAPGWSPLAEADPPRRWPYAVAATFHAALLLVQLPGASLLEAEPEKRPPVILHPPPRFEPPQPPPTDVPLQPTRIQPIPDPTPDEPEPLFQEVAMEPVLKLPPVDGLFVFPEPPPAPPATAGPIPIQGEVHPPEVLKRIKPRYTELARRARREGIVVLQAVIDTEGRVVDARILKPLGLGLDEAALEAARQWSFTPATLQGRPVAVYLNLTVTFDLG